MRRSYTWGLQLGPHSEVADVEAFESTTLFTSLQALLFARAAEVWPAMPIEPPLAPVLEVDVPMLLMNGTIDTATPIEMARRVATRWEGPNRTFVEFPEAHHGTFFNTHTTASLAGDEPTCGAQIAGQFMASPETAPDTSCVGAVLPRTIGGTPERNMEVMGTEDLWGD